MSPYDCLKGYDKWILQNLRIKALIPKEFPILKLTSKKWGESISKLRQEIEDIDPEKDYDFIRNNKKFIESCKTQAQNARDHIKGLNKSSDKIYELIKNIYSASSQNIEENKNEIQLIEQKLELIRGNINTQEGEIESHQRDLEEIFSLIDQKDDIDKKIEEITQYHDNAKENLNKIDNFISHSSKRRNEIKEIHDEIFGYTIEGGESEEGTFVPGMKSDLETAYDQLKEAISSSEKDLEDKKSEYQSEINSFIENNKNQRN